MFSPRNHVRGPVTYRHLHSAQAMTAFNPLRSVILIDIDGAYAQFEQVRLGLPDDVPLVCAQWESLIAVNYPARAFGIKRMTSIVEAKKLCPHLVVAHVPTYRAGDSESGYWPEVDRRTHKVSLDPYRRESLKILAIFREMAPKGELEKASIDEAFIDLTLSAIDRLMERHPHLKTVPEDAPDGLDSPLPPPPPIDWGKCGNVVPVQKDGGEEEEQSQTDEEVTWEDWALCMAAEITAEVRKEVFERLHYTCSAGIAHNKPLAKVCAGYRKPNQQTLLRLAATPGFLRDMDFTDIRFLGGKLGHAIAEEFKAKTVGDLLPVTLEEMQAKFGEEAIWVYNIIRGIDHTEVKEKLATKSMLASKNTIPNVTTPEQGHHWLSVLSGELCVRLKEAREASPGLWPKTIVLGTRIGWNHRTRQLPFPYARELTPEFITKQARKLWDEATVAIKPGEMRFNNISLSFTGLAKLEDGQRGIEGFFAGSSAGPPAKKQRTDRSTSTLRTNGEVAEPKPEGPPTRGKTQLESFLSHSDSALSAAGNAEHTGRSGTSSPILVVDDEPEPTGLAEDDGSETAKWTCPRCGFSDEASRTEHEDFHFAQDLQAQYGDVSIEQGSSSSHRANDGQSSTRKGSNDSNTSKGRKKETKKKTDIKAFFAPKK